MHNAHDLCCAAILKVLYLCWMLMLCIHHVCPILQHDAIWSSMRTRLHIFFLCCRAWMAIAAAAGGEREGRSRSRRTSLFAMVLSVSVGTALTLLLAWHVYLVLTAQARVSPPASKAGSLTYQGLHSSDAAACSRSYN